MATTTSYGFLIQNDTISLVPNTNDDIIKDKIIRYLMSVPFVNPLQPSIGMNIQKYLNMYVNSSEVEVAMTYDILAQITENIEGVTIVEFESSVNEATGDMEIGMIYYVEDLQQFSAVLFSL